MDDQLKLETITYWLESANRDLNTAKAMCDHGHYDWSLFVGQLALEKLLKGLIVKTTNQQAPMIHNLTKLAITAKISLNSEQITQLDRISKFNIEARYSEVKQELYRLASKDFSATWIKIIEELFLWIQNQF